MADDLYCSRGDVNERVPGGITFEGRLVESALATSDTLTLDGHGFETDTPVYVRAADGGSLPTGLAAGTTYYAKRLTNATFQLAAAPAGAAIDFTTDGVDVLVFREPPYDNTIEFVSRWADGFFPAHVVPFDSAAVPALVRGVVADVAAKRLMNADGKSSAVVDAAELAGKAILERYAAGLPLRDSKATARTNKAIVSTLTDLAPDARGWPTEAIP